MIKVEEFNYSALLDIPKLTPPKGNRGTRKRDKYLDIVCAFDIETTTIVHIEQAVMYIWQFQFGDMDTVIGRTWDEFLEFLGRCKCYIPDGWKLVIYVHNLPYEFQFMAGVYNFVPDDVFCLDSRRPAKCCMFDTFEFRCSYIQTNMSLDRFTSKMGVESLKLKGFDYTKQRFWYTTLSPEELAYCVNDVKGLVQAISIEMERDGDNLYTIPMTSTGYVRREFKSAMRGITYHQVRPILPTWAIYEMLREAFRGGNVHGSRFYYGEILDEVQSADRSSSYPAVQLNHDYPISRFCFVPNCDCAKVEKLINIRGKALIMRVRFTKVQLTDEFWPVPYLSKDKCRHIIGGVFDNGRILSCDSCETTITDVDYRIIMEEYACEVEIIQCASSRYGKLPVPMTDVVIRYYKAKTELKGVAGQEYYYMKSKNLLNSVYGCTGQDPVKDGVLFDGEEYEQEGGNPRDLLEKSNRRAFIPYQWGVWCTAWARWELERGIRLAHEKADFVYCDTDSVKYIGDLDWSVYNNAKIAKSTETGAYATDPQGITHYMGVFEKEDTYKRFITWGSKKYAYEHMDGSIGITVAGVPKKAGAKELEAAGGLEAFKPGFVFHAGKLKSVYNDKVDTEYVTSDGEPIRITRNVALLPTTYVLGAPAEYNSLLKDAHKYKKAVDLLRKNGIIKV